MRCPKCHYISFDTGERCRNCGYDFSLALELPQPPELPLRSDADPLGPLADFSLGNLEVEGRPDAPAGDRSEFALDHLDTPKATPGSDLPLFTAGAADATPRIARAPVPRAPLSVRRATPEVPRAPAVRPRPEAPPLEFELTPPELQADADASVQTNTDLRPAGAGARLAAALVDGALVATIDAAVVYFTLRLCDLPLDRIDILPKIPLAGFFALLNGGYFAGFTAASGQTIGKMAAGIKVVRTGDGRVRLGFAVLRTAAYVLSALPVGLGFVAGLVGREKRALHDRLADTRVVKVS